MLINDDVAVHDVQVTHVEWPAQRPAPSDRRIPRADNYAFTVLLRDAGDASMLARLLRDVDTDGGTAVSVVPPVRGRDFFADDRRQLELDEWWAANVIRDALPIYVLEHEDSLWNWLEGLDGWFYVSVPDATAADLYNHVATVVTLVGRDVADYVAAVRTDFGWGDEKPAEHALPTTDEPSAIVSLPAPHVMQPPEPEQSVHVTPPAMDLAPSKRTSNGTRSNEEPARPMTSQGSRFRRAQLSGSAELFRRTVEKPKGDAEARVLAEGVVSVLTDTLKRLEKLLATPPAEEATDTKE